MSQAPLTGSLNGWRRLGALLVEEGLLAPNELVEAFAEQAKSGRRIGEIVVDRGWVDAVDVGLVLARQYGLEYLDLADVDVDPAAASLVTEAVARRYRALPIALLDDDRVLVAAADPPSVVGSDDLRMMIGKPMSFVVVDQRDLELVIGRVFRPEVEIESDELTTVEESDLREEIWNAATSVPAVKVVNAALSRAIEEGASDVHFDPEETNVVVRIRVDGVVRELMSIPKKLQAGIISRLKIMGSLDIAERRAPQDGRVFVRHAGKPMDLRIAILPTTHGERAVLRVLQRAATNMSLSELGMNPAAEAAFYRAVHQPYGAVITVGPTGSGKTTTLYAGLQLLNQPDRILMTIEDPVEYQIPGVAQVEVRPKSGLTFARGLRTILRSDPDVLLVGEIRDEETARIAIQAAMTGHLVLTSLHAHNAASSIARLKDMGVEPGLLAAAVNCIVAQRLARRLCMHCREAYAASEEDLAELGVDAPADGSPVVLHRPVGCVRCARTGYEGRVALYEVMAIQGRLRGLVAGSTEEIFAAAVETGMKTMRQDGMRLCLAGVSSLDEVRRVTGDRLH